MKRGLGHQDARQHRPSRMRWRWGEAVDRLTEEGKEITLDDVIACCNIRFKIDPEGVRRAFEEAAVDLGLTNANIRRLFERAKARAIWEHSGPPGGVPSGLQRKSPAQRGALVTHSL